MQLFAPTLHPQANIKMIFAPNLFRIRDQTHNFIKYITFKIKQLAIFIDLTS